MIRELRLAAVCLIAVAMLGVPASARQANGAAAVEALIAKAAAYVREYRDHHNFDHYDLDAVRETFKNLGDVKKIIVTTEKDAARLEEHANWFSENKIEIFVQPIAVKFIDADGDKFNADVVNYIEHVKQRQ